MNNPTRQFYLLERPTAPDEPRRFSLYDAVSDTEFEVREIPPAAPPCIFNIG